MAIEILFDDAPGEDSEGRLGLWLDQRIGFSLNRRLALYQNLARKLRQNEMINRVLLRRAEQAGKFGNRWEARMLRRIERLLTDEGASFAYTLQPFVPDDEFTMLLSGEQADDLPAALDMICDTPHPCRRARPGVPDSLDRASPVRRHGRCGPRHHRAFRSA
jgi:hypothetical protein